MGQTKNYLLRLQERCSEELFGQEAIEWAVFNEHIKLTYHLDADVRNVMAKYDDIIMAYQQQCREHGDALVEVYRASGLLEEILRPVPPAIHHQSVQAYAGS